MSRDDRGWLDPEIEAKLQEKFGPHWYEQTSLRSQEHTRFLERLLLEADLERELEWVKEIIYPAQHEYVSFGQTIPAKPSISAGWGKGPFRPRLSEVALMEASSWLGA